MLPECRLVVVINPHLAGSAYVDTAEGKVTAPAHIEPAQLGYIVERAARLIAEGAGAVPEAEPMVRLRVVRGGAA